MQPMWIWLLSFWWFEETHGQCTEYLATDPSHTHLGVGSKKSKDTYVQINATNVNMTPLLLMTWGNTWPVHRVLGNSSLPHKPTSWATQTQTGSNLRFTLPRNLPKPQMQRLLSFEEGCMSSDQLSREEKFRPLHLRQSNDRWRPVSASMAALLRRKSDDSRWLRVLKMPPDCHFDCPSAFCITECCSLHDPGN